MGLTKQVMPGLEPMGPSFSGPSKCLSSSRRRIPTTNRGLLALSRGKNKSQEAKPVFGYTGAQVFVEVDTSTLHPFETFQVTKLKAKPTFRKNFFRHVL